jgi:CDP-diacylglycerol---serine O-phosphatidyltransferase
MRKVALLPNLFTSANIFCGVYSLSLVLKEVPQYSRAAWFILLAMFFDFLDGQVARRYRATSDFGVEYDSLADFFSFGIVTTIIAYRLVLQQMQGLGVGVAFLYIIFCALRLARFNIQTDKDKEEKVDFRGLPSPVAAGVLLSFIIFIKDIQLSWEPVIPVLMIVLGALMVTGITYPTLLALELRKKKPFIYLLVIILMLGFLLLFPQIVIFIAFVSYLILGFYDGIRVDIREKKLTHPTEIPDNPV